jgi:predicted metalloprotease with PDZ domain
MGSGHLEDREGVPHQLAALGTPDAVVLLPWDSRQDDCNRLQAGFADLVFGVDTQATPQPPRLAVTLSSSDPPRVLAIDAEGIGARAGLASGDEIITVAGRPVRRVADIQAALREAAPGYWLPLQVRRGDQILDLVAKFPT